MLHTVIGGGNLGLDLFKELKTAGNAVGLLTRTNGWDFRCVDQLPPIAGDVIWVCVGQGSIAEADKDRHEAEEIYVKAPMALLERLANPEALVIFFSTDYAADEALPNRADRFNPAPKSLYAALRCTFERDLARLNRDRTVVIRVGSLYGLHKPHRTLPGRLLANLGFAEGKIDLPLNMITPTPTRWLAATLVENFDSLHTRRGVVFHHLAPAGAVSVRDLGRFVLAGLREPKDYDKRERYDESRPRISNLGCSLKGVHVPHWYDLWRTYFRARWFTPRAFLERLPPSALNEDTGETPAL